MTSTTFLLGAAGDSRLKSAGWLTTRRTARRTAFVLAAVAALFAGAVLLLGWLFDMAVIRGLPGQPGISISSAASLLGVAALIVCRTWPWAERRRGYRPLPPAILLAVALVDLVLLAADTRRGLDQVLFGFSDPRGDIYMSPATALCLALAATTLLLPLRRRRLFGIDAFGVATASGLAITIFALTGYLFDSAALREIFFFAAMSPQTAFGFFLVFGALAASQPEHGWMSVVLGPGPGSATLRRTLPFLACGPFVLCWLTLVAVDTGYFNANFRLSMLALAAACGLVALGLWSAQRQNAVAHDLVRSNAKLRRALAERDVLLREVYHRVKNNLQFIDAMLALESAESARGSLDPARRFTAIRRRLHALSLVHQQLIDSRDLATISLAGYLRELCANMIRGVGLDQNRIDLEVEIDDLNIDLDRAVPIGLVMAELLSNVAKHAFPDGACGSVAITARNVGDGYLELSVQDNGVGRSGEPAAEGRVGSIILQSLVDQLNAEMSVQDETGCRVTLRVPLQV